MFDMCPKDMSFCAGMRSAGVFMYVSNREDWGHLVDADGFETSHRNNELYQVNEHS